jgi:putative transposase
MDKDESVEVLGAPVAFILRQAEEVGAIGEVYRKAGISEARFNARRKKYAGLMPSEGDRQAPIF